MPKRVEPQDAKPFQPIKAQYLKGVLGGASAPAREEPAVAVIDRPEPTNDDHAVAVPAEPPPRVERKVLAQSPAEVQAVGARPRRARVPAPAPGGERLNRPLKVQLPPSERTELSRIVNELSETFATPLSASHVVRALLTIVRHAEENIQARARLHGPIKRPANDDLTGIAIFEQELGKLLLGALRDARPLK